MESTVTQPLRKTSLHAWHMSSGAKMMPFAGWDMPVEYAGVLSEHAAVRQRVGLFDVSHMGEIEIAGRDALMHLQRLVCGDVSTLANGQALYSGLLTPAGTFLDDLLVYRLAAAHFLLVVNASRVAADYRHIAQALAASGGDVVAVDVSARYALIAVQGPRAAEVLQPLTGVDLGSIRYYWFAHGEVAGARATIARTGYTGEDGFELFVPPSAAQRVWTALLDAGRDAGVQPCGLAARDTLRLEASMRLYGQDIDETTTPLEAGLGWIVAWDKPGFEGADALRQQRQAGAARTLVGFRLLEPGIARHGHQVYAAGTCVGVVTSGSHAPFLKQSIGMAYVPTGQAVVGATIEIDIRGRRVRAEIVRMPFYRRASASPGSA